MIVSVRFPHSCNTYCETCSRCGRCNAAPECTCEPPEKVALDAHGRCEECWRSIVAGERIRVWADDVVTHVRCKIKRAVA